MGAAAARGGVLRIRLAGPIPHLNPLTTNNTWVRRIAVPNVLEPLLTVEPKTGAFKPVLAVRFAPIWDMVSERPKRVTRRPVMPSGKRLGRPPSRKTIKKKKAIVGYLFQLRKGVKWHDGKPFTAKDVAFTLRKATSRTGNRNAIPGGMLFHAALSKVDVISDLLVEVRTLRPFGPLLEVLSQIPILPKHRYEACDQLAACADINKEMVGTGPFKVVQWWPMEKLVLARNEGYWGKKSKLERMEVHYHSSMKEAVEKMRDGGLELLTDLTTREYEKAEKELLKGKSSTRFRKAVAFPPATASLYFNWVKTELREPRVRRAISLILNKSRLARMQPGGGTPLLEHPVSLASYQYRLLKLPRWRRDERTAALLLKQAGWRRSTGGYRRKAGRTLHLSTLVPDAASTMLRFWKLSKLDFKKAGIKLQVDVLPFGHYVKALRSVKYHLVTVVTAQPAPWCNLYSGFHSTMRYSGTNFGRVSDKKLDKMLLKWLAEPHIKRRRDMERNILSRVRKITAVFPLYSPPLTAIVSRRVRNLKRGGQWWRFDRVRVRPD